MKYKILTIIDIIAFSLIATLMLYTAYQHRTTEAEDIAALWLAPVLGMGICLLFQLFISHPAWLAKKAREHFENDTHPSEAIVLKWKRSYHYLRLILLALITIISITP